MRSGDHGDSRFCSTPRGQETTHQTAPLTDQRARNSRPTHHSHVVVVVPPSWRGYNNNNNSNHHKTSTNNYQRTTPARTSNSNKNNHRQTPTLLKLQHPLLPLKTTSQNQRDSIPWEDKLLTRSRCKYQLSLITRASFTGKKVILPTTVWGRIPKTNVRRRKVWWRSGKEEDGRSTSNL